jgi:O6-methylguanine-DNA--protein-cysteine methyltransferase
METIVIETVRSPLGEVVIWIPCHRVLGSNGALTGHAGKVQSNTKQMLLEMEKAH